ncbi:MAG: gliding motility protein GldM [Crocinitomicaceae bacterium]|nr:gliding motility protein GldM [Crocinitomicaceae bacterium]
MAGGKETPRQKMIGMMYLVLTALLALNISKDVLNAFIQINKSLGVTNSVLEAKADATIEGLRASKEAEKAAPFLAKAEEVANKGDEMIAYIEELKARVMACSMKSNKDGAGYEEFMKDGKAIEIGSPEGREKVAKPDENQNNTTLLVGQNPQAPRTDPWSANELKQRLEAYRDWFKTIEVTNIAGKQIKLRDDVISSINSAFVFPEEENEGVKEVWETSTFYHSPLVAVIATLSKIQADVLNAKTSAITDLATSINTTDLKFTDVTVAVVPKQSYVLKGDSFVAEVYLAAYNKNSQTRIYMGGEFDGKSIPEVFDYAGKEAVPSGPDGKCKFKVNTGSLGLGEHAYKGVIVYKDAAGEDKPIAFAIPPFFVGEPALVVSPTQMNVFYRGLDNPVEISVPGVGKSALKVSMEGGSISGPGGDGTYTVKPGQGNEATIRVTANVNGKDTPMPPKKFRIKRIPDPVPSFGGKKPFDSSISQGDASVAAGVRADMEGFDFNVKVLVKSFKLTITNQGSFKEFKSSNNAVTGDMTDNIKKAKKGEKIFIEEIMVDMPDGTTRKVASITLKIV